jgi:predicted amidohydrolase
MARYIRVSTIGAKNPVAEPSCPSLVKEMQAHLAQQLDKVMPDNPDLVLLPEICDRFANFSDEQNRRYFAECGTELIEYMAQWARRQHCYIAYPTLLKAQDDHYRNAIILFDREGNIAGQYHKLYPVISELEETGILAGKVPVVIQCDFGSVGFAICFDLCFQEMIEPYRKLAPDMMLFASNYHGGHVQKAWAYGTRSYFVSAVQGLESSILSPLGSVVARSTNYYDYVTATINLDRQITFLGLNKDKLRRAKEKYKNRISISDPGYLGAVLFTSECDDFTATDIVREFAIETIDPYFQRVRETRLKYLEQ